MQIISLTINGFLNRTETMQIHFAPDLNIITGYNGAGKTNILKLIWYTLSGNIFALMKEVHFKDFTLVTDLYEVSINKLSDSTCRGYLKIQDRDPIEIEDVYDEDNDLIDDAREIFHRRLQKLGSSLFFPTFRRIEGGFTIPTDGSKRMPNTLNLIHMGGSQSELQESVLAISRRLSNGDHTFITSISTIDIADLLLKRYTEMSELASQAQDKMSQEVIEKIRNFKDDSVIGRTDYEDGRAIPVLESISDLIERTDRIRDRIMAPLAAVQTLVARIFRHKGIQVNRRVSFGDTATAINSELLSAGEKQMLSFICYNAFTQSSPIFIDEPELSLHVDWQRTLFPTLISQGKANQFIVATHSPFIYGKYPEKEIQIVADRGE